MFPLLFAHGDPITLIVLLTLEAFRAAADAAAENAGPIVGVILKLVGIVIVLPLFVLVLGFVCGMVTAIAIRKKRWLFLAVAGEALALYAVFCVPAGFLLLDDWPAFYAWLTIILGGLVSMLAGVLDGVILVSLIALISALTRKQKDKAPG